MTNKQKEAIERLEKRIKDNEDYKTTQVWLTDDVSTVYTVLNMLKEKDKEIEKLKKQNKELLRKLRNRVKEVKKLNKYSLYKKEFKTLNEQLKNKDKIIDLMAEFIYAMWCDYPGSFTKALRNGGFDDKECGTCESKEKNCLDCIKQYFKSKAEKE